MATLHTFTGNEVIATEVPQYLNQNFKAIPNNLGIWEANEAVKVGDTRILNGRENTGYILECVQEGTTGSSQPIVSDEDVEFGTSKTSNINEFEGVLGIEKGGTNATTASEACANIGALPLSGGTLTGQLSVSEGLNILGGNVEGGQIVLGKPLGTNYPNLLVDSDTEGRCRILAFTDDGGVPYVLTFPIESGTVARIEDLSSGIFSDNVASIRGDIKSRRSSQLTAYTVPCDGLLTGYGNGSDSGGELYLNEVLFHTWKTAKDEVYLSLLVKQGDILKTRSLHSEDWFSFYYIISPIGRC